MSGTVYLTCPGGKKYYRSTFRLAGRPRERSFKDLANAKAWLKAQLQNVVRGKAQRAAISAQEVDEYHTAKKLIASSGVSLIEAARAYVATHEGLIETRIDEAVSVFLDFKLSSGVDRENLRITEIYLKKLKEGFSGPIHTLDTATVRDWLASLKGVSNRYRNNISGAINSLLRFGARRNWIREEFSPIERFKVEVTDNVIWEPDELRRLLSAAHLEIVPFLAIAAFAGLRTSELCRLDVGSMLPNLYSGNDFAPIPPVLAQISGHRSVSTASRLCKREQSQQASEFSKLTVSAKQFPRL
ncbi:hypothetical protein N8766_04395 [bacterium]|nr:hypothetical protein [bacterium]